MCGITLLYRADSAPVAQEIIQRMNAALAHRGPDASDVLLRGNVGLGHTRLSIVDIAAGAQPMVTTDGALAIVFNGEIYNYRELRAQLMQSGCVFHTQSDTEVILEAYRRYGAACPHHLRGMFSFAIHDRDTGRLFIARDRLGIKPLFYHWDGHSLVAASEMKALFASGVVIPRLNVDSIKSYFTFQHAISPHTPFEGVFELPPGHTLTLQAGHVPVIAPYWDLHFPREHEYESMDTALWVGKFSDALHDAAATHTIGEVPIGAYLSGGIDSAAMAWLLKQHYPQRLRTFSIRFLNPHMDESPVFRGIAQHLGVDAQELVMDDQRETGFLREFEQCIYHLEQPQRLAVDIPHFQLSDLVRRQGYKVVYTGDGSDEILAGYDCFRQEYMRQWGNAEANPKQRRAKYLTEYTQWFAPSYVRMLWRNHRMRNQRRVIKQFGCYPAWFDFWQITHGLLPGLFTSDFVAATRHNRQMEQSAEAMRPQMAGRHWVNQSLYLETKTRLPGWILWKSDRLSMAHSVEARVPFMDHPLVELAARMPPHLKLHEMNEKYALKQVAMPHLPPHPAEFKKRAFYTPIREWFFTPARREQLEVYLSLEALRTSGIFEPQYVHRLWAWLMGQPVPQDAEHYYRVMQREWMLMLILSVQVLQRQFVQQTAPCFSPRVVE